VTRLPYGLLTELRERLSRLEAAREQDLEFGDNLASEPIKRVRHALAEAERLATIPAPYSMNNGTALIWLEKEVGLIRIHGWGSKR